MKTITTFSYDTNRTPCETIRDMFRETSENHTIFLEHFRYPGDEGYDVYDLNWTKSDCDAVCREYTELREKLSRIAANYPKEESGNNSGLPEDLVTTWEKYAAPPDLGGVDYCLFLDLYMPHRDLHKLSEEDRKALRRAIKSAHTDARHRLGDSIGAEDVCIHAFRACKLEALKYPTLVREEEHLLAIYLVIYRFARKALSI